jgi:hypothetical protein
MKHVLLLLAVMALASCSKREPTNANGMRDTFAESLELSLEANRISQPPEGQSSFQMSKAQEDRMLSLSDQAVQKGGSLDSKFLAWLDKELPDVYRDKFIEGQKLYAQGIRNGNPTLQIKGNQLLMQWQSFWEAHKTAITDKMYPK